MAISGKALVVDDEPMVRQLVRLYLEGEGMAVIEAGDGVEAVAKVRDERPDIVILDMRMPRKSGLEVLQEIADEVPVVVLSAVGDQAGYVTEALGFGAKSVLRKPFRGDELIDQVQTLLKGG